MQLCKQICSKPVQVRVTVVEGYTEERKARALCIGAHSLLGHRISGTRALPCLNYATEVFVLTIEGQTSPVAF